MSGKKDEEHATATATKHASKSKTPTAHTVTFSKTAITPNSIKIDVGDSVHWSNADDSPHSVHFVAPAEGAAPPPANSGDIRPGQGYDAQFSAAGTFEYTCDHNPAMRGSVVVS